MSDPHRYWGELAAIALVGTGRQPALPPPPDGALGRLLAGSAAGADPAAALLAAAAATAIYLDAAALPYAGEAVPVPPCAGEDLPPCGPQAARHLAETLDRRQRAVLPEWLQAVVATGRRAPDELLPSLLEVARGDTALRPLVLPALGRRGRWLAGLNPDWAFAAEGGGTSLDAAAATAIWQTAPRNGRLFLLESLRPTRPALARALIEGSWAGEKADDRAAFVAAMRVGLSDDDEPFLEAALDDRGKEVRAAAAELLARLPDSRLAGRVSARALAMVGYRGGLLARIEVRLPDTCDKALQRDGVDPRPPRGVGERAWWLGETVRRTPPAAWCRDWGLTPAAILGVRVDKEWRPLLLKAWSQAALAYGDMAWVDALAELAVRELVGLPTSELLEALPAARREPLLIRLLASSRKPFGGEHLALPALRAAPRPWGIALAQSVLDALARRFAHAGDGGRDDWQLRAALEEFALAISPELADEAAHALPPQLATSPYWADTVQTYTDRLRLRRDMHLALRDCL